MENKKHKKIILILCVLAVFISCIELRLKVNRKTETMADSIQLNNSKVVSSEDTVDTEVQQPVKLASDLIIEQIPGNVLEEDQIGEDNLTAYFRSYEISDQIYARINGRSYYENPDIGLESLRYLKVLHYNFDHQIQVGELIVNVELAADYLDIFRQLFENEYEIQSMFLIDNYWTGEGSSSDTASIQENNTSAFCYRLITGGSGLSNHALGKAIDINPQQNPYVSYEGENLYWHHDNASEYVERNAELPHMIDHDDLCYQLFIQHGFTWGGDWSEPKDYQHFEYSCVNK